MNLEPVHRTLVGVDIEKYSDRGDRDHHDLRLALRRVLGDAMAAAGETGVTAAEVQDQGDAYLILFRPDVSKLKLVDGLVREVGNGLRRHNESRVPSARMRLRISIHAGELQIDGTGFPGRTTVDTMRLLNSQQARDALAGSDGDLVLIVSQRIYEDVVVHGYGSIIPTQYRRVEVVNKSFRGTAWIWLPGRPETAAPSMEPTPEPVPARERGRTGAPTPSFDMREAFQNAQFSGPTSFGGHAAGRDIIIGGTADDSTGY